MDNLLPVDKMASLLNLIQSRLQVIVPTVQPLISELLALIDSHYACQSVNLCTNPFVDDHITEFVLCSLHGNSNELTHPCKRDATVVSLNHTQVVLNELSDQLDKMVLAVEGLVLKWLEGCHLLRDVILLQRHKLEGQEFPHIFRQKLILFELTRVHSLDQVKRIDLFIRVG